MRLSGQHISAPDAGGHGLDMSDGQSWLVEDCLIDLSACPLEQLDEAVGVTWGSSAVFRRCVIRGAGKLLLCGSGDAGRATVEHGKTVILEDCLLEDFGRRGPEAQAGMHIVLRRCLIRNWGVRSRFTVRAFGAWAHDGASIRAEECVFWQDGFWQAGLRGLAVDMANWIGWCWNRRDANPLHWIMPGVCRGLMASQGGTVSATRCWKNRWWIRLGGHVGPRLSRQEAQALMAGLARRLPRPLRPT